LLCSITHVNRSIVNQIEPIVKYILILDTIIDTFIELNAMLKKYQLRLIANHKVQVFETWHIDHRTY
jgi:hypothetical protein